MRGGIVAGDQIGMPWKRPNMRKLTTDQAKRGQEWVNKFLRKGGRRRKNMTGGSSEFARLHFPWLSVAYDTGKKLLTGKGRRQQGGRRARVILT